ncbi:TatD DNase family Scn1 [Mycena rebaudengoi]|nr:TatD DNase family Scn1 [Mycena rebaudengoi]
MALPSNLLAHIVDVHCHPTDGLISDESMRNLHITLLAQSTRSGDQRVVRNLSLSYPNKVIPCFGYHPWFTHTISVKPISSKYEHYKQLFGDSEAAPQSSENNAIFEELVSFLPEPIPIDQVILDLRHNFELFSTTTAVLGEVGLDKAFRVAFDSSASPRRLSPFTIPLDHQLAILEAQLDLAVELGRNVSFHSVKAPLATLELFQRMNLKHGSQWENIRIDMHSCSMSPEAFLDLQRRQPNNIFLSLSTAVNGRSKNLKKLISMCPSNRILVESDINDIEQTTERCVEMLKIVAEVKGWHVEDQEWSNDADAEEANWGAIRRLEANWVLFRDGESPKNSER